MFFSVKALAPPFPFPRILEVIPLIFYGLRLLDHTPTIHSSEKYIGSYLSILLQGSTGSEFNFQGELWNIKLRHVFHLGILK